MRQQQAMLRAMGALQGLNPRQFATVMSAMPAAPARLSPRDMVIEDLRQLALADYMRAASDPNTSVEGMSAARQQLIQLLAPIAGNNQAAFMLGE